MQSENSLEEGCQYKYNLGFEDEHRCPNPIIPPARRYCELHKESGPKQNKAITQKKGEFVKNFRKDKRDAYLRQNSNSEFRRLHDLTKRHLIPLVARGEALRELSQGLKEDDLCQDVLEKLAEINDLWRDPPTDLPSAHAAVKEKIWDMRAMLECHPADDLNTPRDRLLWRVKELQRDQGGWMLSNPFPSLWQQAESLQEAWRDRGDLHNLCHALLVKAELSRQCFFATSDNMQWWKRSVRWIDAGAFVARLYKGKHKRISTFLYDFYTWQAGISLALDRDAPDEATGYIHSIQDRAEKVADAWGEGSPVSETALFISSKQQALYYLYRQEPAEAEKHFTVAETMFSKPIQWRPVSEHQSLAYIKAWLAIKKDAKDREELVHEYIALWSRNPSFEQYRNLARLKRVYESEIPETLLTRDMSIYVETCFSYLQPILLQAEEGGDGIESKK